MSQIVSSHHCTGERQRELLQTKTTSSPRWKSRVGQYIRDTASPRWWDEVLLRETMRNQSSVITTNHGLLDKKSYRDTEVCTSTYLQIKQVGAWNNGKEVPRWGVAEIQKMSPSTNGRCYCCHYLSSYWSHEISADQSPSRNCIRRPGVVGKTILDVQTWSKE